MNVILKDIIKRKFHRIGTLYHKLTTSINCIGILYHKLITSVTCFEGCLYQGLCQPFDFNWKNFEGATLRCTKDENKGYKIRTVKPGKPTQHDKICILIENWSLIDFNHDFYTCILL